MPTWVPKAGAPARISLASDFLALITGDTQWEWLTPWVWVLGVQFFDTAEFCAKGPGPTLDPLSITDFLTPTIGPNRLWDKLGNVARDRIFGAYCQQPSSDGWSPYTCEVFTSGPPGAAHVVAYGPLPAGTSRIRWYSTLWSAPTSGDMAVAGAPDGSSRRTSLMYPGQNSATIGPEERPETVYPGDYIVTNFQGNGGAGTTMTFCWSVNNGAGAQHIPTPQPPVIGALEPVHNTYTSIADLGVELDHQEEKLDQLRQTLAFLVQIQAAPSLAPDEVEPGPDLPVDPPVGIPAGAIAAVVTVSNIPASSNVEQLDPQRYSRLGQITLGTADGWLPSIRIEHNPQLIVPLPPWAKLIRVGVFSPAAATVRFLSKL